MNEKTLKVIGIVLWVVGGIVGFASDKVSAKQEQLKMQDEVKEEIARQLADIKSK